MIPKKLHLVAAMVVLAFVGVSTLTLADEMRVRDVPIAEGATDITYVKRRGDVRYDVPSDFKAVGNFYAKKLAEQGWTKAAKQNLQRDFWVQSFSKGGVSLEVRVDSHNGGSEVRLTPKGMMWEEDDQPSPKDLPLPEGATEIKYDDFFESLEFKSPSNVKTVVEFLSKELEKRKWSKTGTEHDFAHFVRMKFAQQKSTLEIDVRAEDNVSEVSIRTKGMQWDGMKAEIARAKQKAQDIAAEAKSNPKETAGVKVASLPKRKDKPKQGIDKLSKLPNEGVVTMDGKTFKLTNVIAFEAFEHDEWLTKIIATQRPIKQETLLARLKKTGTDEDEGRQMTWPQPYVQVVLDENDRPRRLGLQALGTPGGDSGDKLSGTALVEDGRARGTVKLKEPGSFFDKVYMAEISFDVAVLTRESTPAKRLANAPKLANSGKLTIGGQTYTLGNVVAYEMKRFDDPMTSVVLSTKPLNNAKLNAALGRSAADDYFEFIPQVRLLIDADDNVSSTFIWADNASISGNSNLESEVAIEDGRARGTARMTEPGEFADSKYNFELSFDVAVLGKRVSTPKLPAGGLAADSYEGLPIPEGHKGMQSEGSPFRKQTSTTVTAALKAVVDFYRRELGTEEWGKWKENTAEAKIEQQTAKLTFSGPTGNLVVQVKADGAEAAITLVSRNSQAAKAAGLLPASGKARLVVGNASEKATVITINKKDFKIAAGAGAEDPKKGLNWELAPGNYTVEVKQSAEQGQSEKLKLGADETWGVIIFPTGGYLATQLY